MKSSVATKKRQNVNQLTVGIDLGDRWGHYCILDEHGVKGGAKPGHCGGLKLGHS